MADKSTPTTDLLEIPASALAQATTSAQRKAFALGLGAGVVLSVALLRKAAKLATIGLAAAGAYAVYHVWSSQPPALTPGVSK